MGGIMSSLILGSAVFAAGIEIARRHPENPWGFLKERVSDALSKFTSGPETDGETITIDPEQESDN